MYATLFGLSAAFIGILGMAFYGAPVYVAGALVLAGVANGMMLDSFLTSGAEPSAASESSPH